MTINTHIGSTHIGKDAKTKIRKNMRRQRASLTQLELSLAERGLVNSARQSNRILNAKRVLSYAPFAGEISQELLLTLLAIDTLHLPRITNFRNCQMRFYPGHRRDAFNQYGIEEPSAIGTPLPANSFDLILVPLVAFDRCGTRIGMGKGYYDRALSALSHQASTKPFLVGTAHHFQEVKSLEAAAWDVPLDAILTDQEFIQI